MMVNGKIAGVVHDSIKQVVKGDAYAGDDKDVVQIEFEYTRGVGNSVTCIVLSQAAVKQLRAMLFDVQNP